MHLADTGCGRRRVVEIGEPIAPAAPELFGQHAVHAGRLHRRRSVLQLRQRLTVRRGHVLRQRGFENRQRLAELHRAALELPEYGEQLLSRALLKVGVDLLGRTPAEPLSQPYGRPAGDAERQ